MLPSVNCHNVYVGHTWVGMPMGADLYRAYHNRTIAEHRVRAAAHTLSNEPAFIEDGKSAKLIANKADELPRLVDRHVGAIGAGFEIERD